MNITRWLSFEVVDKRDWLHEDDPRRWDFRDVRVTVERPTDRVAVLVTVQVPTRLLAPAVAAQVAVLELPDLLVPSE